MDMTLTEAGASPAAPLTAEPPPATAAISLRGLEKSFGGIRAIDHANLEVRPGEVHALVGENGAGKSTLLKALAGLVRPDAGVIRIGDENFEEMTPLLAREHGIA